VRLRTYDIRGKKVQWVPMFAANDRESVVMTLKTLRAQWPDDATVIGVLNNRRDRGRRAELFASMASRDLKPFLDHFVLFGAYEDSVCETMVGDGVPTSTVHKLGDAKQPSLDEILDHIASLIPGDKGVLIGMVNIHTHQAEMLMEYFEHAAGEDHVDEIAASLDPARQPAARHRLRRVAARRGAMVHSEVL
ncbi:MAG: hypothetical protein KDB63_06465, partial [Nocardioidaceae bacterium]|nr:hypothetical protein [Nocardioidaceae bacterium]